MGRHSVFTPETMSLARRLREEEGKTFSEIAKILGINADTIKKTAKKNNWSSANSNIRKIESVKATETVRKIKKENSELNSSAEALVQQLRDIGIENILTFGKLALEPLMLRNIKIALQSNNYKTISETIRDIIRLMESEALSFKETERRLTVMVPTIREIYEDPPQDEDIDPLDGEEDNIDEPN